MSQKEKTSGKTPGKDKSSESKRLLSLDALRGFDMFWIVGASGLFVGLEQISDNAVFRAIVGQLEHVEWEGFAFYDLIFPLFLFMIGTALVYSLGKSISQDGLSKTYVKIFRRSLLLYLLGLFYYGGISDGADQIRYVGVLQRLAISYCITALLFCHLKWKGMAITCGSILIGYWACLTFISFPGSDAGRYTVDHNLTRYIDSIWLPGRRWNGDWDPEGLFSNLTAVASCISGVLAGLLIQNTKINDMKKVTYLCGGGVISVALGFLWGMQFPVIKNIWTSSYVLVAAGYSGLLLGLFYWVIEVLKFRAWATPFVWIGMNPITIYMAANLLKFRELSLRLVGGEVLEALGRFGQLMVAIVALGMVFALARFMYKKNIFLRL